MFFLQLRMYGLLAVLFAIVYALVVVIGTSMGMASFNFYLIFSFVLMFIQYMIGPKMVEWSMKCKYVTREEQPSLFAMVEDQAQAANIPMPKVCVSPLQIPNAFAFGRGRFDGRVCVTQGIMGLLNKEELKAVIGHEIAHIRNRDILTMTLLSVIPMIMWRIAWHYLFFGRRQSNGLLIGLAAFGFYFLTNFLVLYASRIREYFADRGSVEFGNRPEVMASALYKLVYGSARLDKKTIKEAEGFKAFFVNDPSRAMNEIRELSKLDSDRNGTIDAHELSVLQHKKIVLSTGDKMMEFLSTHPNMLKRIKHLSDLKMNM